MWNRAAGRLLRNCCRCIRNATLKEELYEQKVSITAEEMVEETPAVAAEAEEVTEEAAAEEAIEE